ncbi:MAG: FG-GAP repeat domain-containing protein [Brachymonas sp.]
MKPTQLFLTTLATCLPALSSAMALMATSDATQCAAAFEAEKTAMQRQQASAPASAAKRLEGSVAAAGSRDIAWAWLASPTVRYPHASMGSATHAGSLHAISRSGIAYSFELPLSRVWEDLQPRLVDLDGDGRDEIVVIEADVARGAALVAYGLPKSGEKLEERARSAWLGLPFRWLNPVGFADFDADGKLDIASVTTPHIGGVLTLYRYTPPRIEAFAKVPDVSNHQMGDPNLQMHAIVSLPGQRPTVIVPDMSRRALHALRWEVMNGKAQWKELADVKPLPGRVNYLMALDAGSACAQLSDNSWWRIDLMR